MGGIESPFFFFFCSHSRLFLLALLPLFARTLASFCFRTKKKHWFRGERGKKNSLVTIGVGHHNRRAAMAPTHGAIPLPSASSHARRGTGTARAAAAAGGGASVTTTLTTSKATTTILQCRRRRRMPVPPAAVPGAVPAPRCFSTFLSSSLTYDCLQMLFFESSRATRN